jgi:hypothetical protein
MDDLGKTIDHRNLKRSDSVITQCSGDLLISVNDNDNEQNEPKIEESSVVVKNWKTKGKEIGKRGWNFLTSQRAGEEALRTIVILLTFGTVTSLMMITQMASDQWFDSYTKGLAMSTTQMKTLSAFREIYATDPLHDWMFEWIPDWSHIRAWFPDLCLTTMMVTTVVFNMIWVHKKRIQYQGLVVFRRFLWILTILYLFRSLTFAVTTVPNPIFNCVPKYANVKDFDSYLLLIRDMASGKVSACTDNIYSGHTSLATLMVFTFWMYSGIWALKIYAVVHGAVIIFSILISRLHYTVDVLIAMFMTSFVFLTFHFLLTITVDDNLLGEDIKKQPLEHLSGIQKVLINERRLLHRVYTEALNQAVWWIDGFDLRLKDHIPRDDDSTAEEGIEVDVEGDLRDCKEETVKVDEVDV